MIIENFELTMVLFVQTYHILKIENVSKFVFVNIIIIIIRLSIRLYDRLEMSDDIEYHREIETTVCRNWRKE